MEPGMEAPMAIKILMVGDSGVGKSCLVMRFCFDSFSDSHISTIGVDFGLKVAAVNGRQCKLMVWDTAGQERYQGITRSYFRGAHAVMVPYDLSDPSSLPKVNSWLEQLNAHATTPHEWMQANFTRPLLCLVGNKVDKTVPGEKRRHREALQAFVADKGFDMGCITSAKTSEGVAEAFHSVAMAVIERSREVEVVLRSLKISPLEGGVLTLVKEGDEKKGGMCGLCGGAGERAEVKSQPWHKRVTPQSNASPSLGERLASPANSTMLTDRTFTRLSDNSVAVVSSPGSSPCPDGAPSQSATLRRIVLQGTL